MECPNIPLINYSDFSKRLYDKINDQRLPINGSIEVTARCNLHCAHCYINLPAGDRQAKERELSTKDLYRIIDQIVDEGCLWLLLTGGEPFIRPDFLDIYTYAKNKGLLITLFTNGTLITPRIADYLAEWSPFLIEITLYGHTEKTYEGVTRVTGSYIRCIQGIELLLERKLPLKLKSVIMTLNKDEIWGIKKYAESLGVDFRFDSTLNMRVDGGRNPAIYRILPEEVIALDLADEKRTKEWREFCNKFLGPSLSPDYLYQCGAGVSTFHIDPFGQLSACIMSRTPAYNLRYGSFHKGWSEFESSVITQKRTKVTPCINCELISLCDQCPGMAQTEQGDPEKKVEYLCQIAHRRAEVFEINNKIGVKL
jgi:radical SAM protein with 4Fe4S-binding SPASM domain